MRFPFYAVKGAVLLTFLTAPAYANQSYYNTIRNATIEQIGQYWLEDNRYDVIRMCRAGQKLNKKGLSYFDTTLSRENLLKMQRKTGHPYDVVKKNTEASHYAMYSVCPNVF